MDVKITNIARSSKKYQYLRRQILSGARRGASLELNTFLKTSLLKLDKSEFATFPFIPADWKLLSKIENNERQVVEEGYISLWIDYIMENLDWLDELSNFSDVVDRCSLSDDSETLIVSIQKLSAEGCQSLYAMKTVAAVAVNNPDKVSSYFSDKIRSNWLRAIFVDGLVASTAAMISSRAFQDAAEFMLSNLKWRPERQTIRYLLRPDLSSNSAILHAYTALLSHPFDALQLLVVEIEKAWSAGRSLSEQNFIKLEELSQKDGKLFGRLQTILSLIKGNISKMEMLDDEDSAFFREATSTHPDFSEYGHLFTSRFFEAIMHCAEHMTPKAESWERLHGFFILWNFSESGRRVRSFLHVLYLTEREECRNELVFHLATLQLKGDFDEVLAGAPSGIDFLRKILPMEHFLLKINEIDTLYRTPGEYHTRFRMCAIHWRIQNFENDVKPIEWLAYVYKWIPIRPSYLSGLNWRWLDEVNQSYRIMFFAADEKSCISYIFSFLVSLTEDPSRDPVAIRAMIKLLNRDGCEDLLAYILTSCNQEFAAALLRYYLDTNEILYLGFATNPAAAIHQRMSSLDYIQRHCPDQNIVTVDYYDSETSALQKSLISQNTNQGQFEFPWHRIHADTRNLHKDYFDWWQDLWKNGRAKAILGEALFSLDHNFKNRQSASYKIKNYQRQFANFVLSFIDEFLTQTSFGLEAILSSRFRHDTLERVFRNSATQLITAKIFPLPYVVVSDMHDYFWPLVSKVLNDWISSNLHSKRKITPDGMFNLVPSQNDLDILVSKFLHLDDFDKAFELVKEWIVTRLFEQLVAVRHSYNDCLREELRSCVNLSAKKIPTALMFNEADTKEYVQALSGAMDHCIEDTSAWFSIPKLKTQGDFILVDAIEVAMQVCDLNANSYSDLMLKNTEVSADMWKTALYTFVDAFANVKKHAPGKKLRISFCDRRLVLSNLLVTRQDRIWSSSVDADNQEALFSEGNSGLTKIAAGMCALSGQAVSVHVSMRRRSFHLVLPLEGLVA